MNLLEIIEQELFKKNITDPVEIKDYMYEKCGKVFTFDPKLSFSTLEERKELTKERIDIRNVHKFSLNCFSWAYGFVDLLHAKNIPAKVKILEKENGKEHAYVEAYIKGEIYLLDLMALFEDIVRIKFDCLPIHNLKLTNNRPENSKKENIRGKTLEIFLRDIKRKLEHLKCRDTEVYTYTVFKTIEGVMNSKIWGFDIDYITGIQFISKLLKEFLGKNDVKNTHFVNKEEEFYAEVYTILKKGKNHYFVYQKVQKGRYELHEEEENVILDLEKKCNHIQGYNLNLRKKFHNN